MQLIVSFVKIFVSVYFLRCYFYSFNDFARWVFHLVFQFSLHIFKHHKHILQWTVKWKLVFSYFHWKFLFSVKIIFTTIGNRSQFLVDLQYESQQNSNNTNSKRKKKHQKCQHQLNWESRELPLWHLNYGVTWLNGRGGRPIHIISEAPSRTVFFFFVFKIICRFVPDSFESMRLIDYQTFINFSQCTYIQLTLQSKSRRFDFFLFFSFSSSVAAVVLN